MKNPAMMKTWVLLVVLSCASPVTAQTFLQQVFPSTDREFVVDVTDDAQVALTVMWNRQNATLLALMTCEANGDEFDWAASAPLQDRSLRMDVGVFTGLFCLISISTDRTAAFAANFQSFEEGNLVKAGSGALRIREAGSVAPEKLVRLRERQREKMTLLRRSAERRVAPARR